MDRITNTISPLLRWGERVTRTDLTYLLKGGFWLFAAQVALGLVSLGVSVAFAHLVPKNVYGTYRFLLSVFWTLSAFTLTGIPTALSRAVAQGGDGEYLRAFRLSILGSMPLSVVSLGMSAYYFAHGNELLAYGGIIIAILGPFMQSAYLYGAYFEGRRDFRSNALFGILINVIPALGLLAVMFVAPNPLAFLGVYLLGYVLAGLSIGAWVYLKHRPKSTGDGHDIRSLSAHFSAMNVLTTISQQFDKLLVFHLLGPMNLAVYTFAITIPDQARMLLGNVESLAFPKFAAADVRLVMSNISRKLFLFTTIVAAGTMVYILLAPYVFHILFPAYAESIPYSQLYALSLIPIGSILPVSLLQAQAAKRELYAYNLLSPVFQIAALLALTLSYGLWGAILARIAGRTFNVVIGLYFANHYAKKTA